MRVVITGATGNVGTSLVKRLSDDDKVGSVLGIARRKPSLEVPKVTWVAADVASHDLMPLFEGADAVVHLAWVIQPSHNVDEMNRINVEGSRRVFDAAARAGVRTIVYASSVGAYSAGPKARRVTESWPTEGISASFYSRHKAAVERILDDLERSEPDMRIVRLRPGLIFKREAASGIRRLFLGPLVPTRLLSSGRIPLVPRTDRLVFQAVHTEDVAEAYALALTKEVRGAFNIAAEPVLDAPTLAEELSARQVPVPAALLRGIAHVTWRARLQPTPSGWVDLGLGAPVMEMARAIDELGWSPMTTAGEALRELLDGFGAGAGLATPPLRPDAEDSSRWREIRAGIGSSSSAEL